MVHETTLPKGTLLPQTGKTGAATQETTPGGDREARWKVVAVAQGLAQASIISGRLETEGLPTRVQREPAGVAIGLTIGLLGEARVLVPEPLAEQALDILSGADPGLEDD